MGEATVSETSRRIRLGFVGGEHLHFRGLLQAALDSPTAEVVGYSIEDDELRAHFQQQHPAVPAFGRSDELYDRGRPEAIVTCADNRRAAAVVAEAAQRGVHVMKEKPMAASLELAEQMATAAARGGVRLMVNWPTNWNPAIHLAKRLVDEGKIGRVIDLHSRAGHGGPPPDFAARGPISRVGWGWLIDRHTNGGGAAVDFCAYGAVTARWLLGQPSAVVGHGGRYAKEFFTVEDNGIMILSYPRAQAVIEGSWTQPAVPVQQPTMIYGEDGALALTGGDEVALANRGTSGELVSTETATVTAPPLPAHYRSGPDYFTHCLLHDEPFVGLVPPAVSRDAQEILDAGLQAMTTGRTIPLPLPAFAA
ncbi:MAG: Gfo/Idh/MocA family oxidoreductase [Candidatus Dormiibacterota bacterium]